MIRWPLLLLVTLIVLGGALSARTSSASFTSASTSTLSASTTTGVQHLLHLYSQSLDPDGLGGYYLQPDVQEPAATGADFSLAVDLGDYKNKEVTCGQVFTLSTPSPLPAGITSIIVTATLLADPGTGLQPIRSVGFGSLGSDSISNPVTLSAGGKMQCTLVVKTPRPKLTAYQPRVLITVTYSGYSGNYFQYSVPVVVQSV